MIPLSGYPTYTLSEATAHTGDKDESGWTPPVDLYKTARGWLLKLELAGVSKRDVQVLPRRDALKIYGKRKDITVRRGCRPLAMEIAYSSFERTIDLPGVTEETFIGVSLRDGMLLVEVEERDAA